MTRDTPTPPADAHAPDANRAGPNASARLPEQCAYLVALLILFILRRLLAPHRARLATWCHDRPDLPPGSAMAIAAARRGNFGTAIAWMCLRRGIGPGHPDWPYLSHTIVTFGGSLKRFRPGMRACGLQWSENPHIAPGVADDTPAATARAVLRARQAAGGIAPPAPQAEPAASGPVPPSAARLSAGRPTGFRGRSAAGPPPVRGLPAFPSLTHGASPWPVPPS